MVGWLRASALVRDSERDGAVHDVALHLELVQLRVSASEYATMNLVVSWLRAALELLVFVAILVSLLLPRCLAAGVAALPAAR